MKCPICRKAIKRVGPGKYYCADCDLMVIMNWYHVRGSGEKANE